MCMFSNTSYLEELMNECILERERFREERNEWFYLNLFFGQYGRFFLFIVGIDGIVSPSSDILWCNEGGTMLPVTDGE